MRHITQVKEINVHRISVRKSKQKTSPWKFNCEKNNIKVYIEIITWTVFVRVFIGCWDRPSLKARAFQLNNQDNETWPSLNAGAFQLNDYDNEISPSLNTGEFQLND
jgi:hypothetical protein